MPKRHALLWLLSEVIELLREPSLEEASDVMAAFSTVLGVELPGSGAAFRKGRERFERHGCARSERNAVRHE